jgi:pyruvate/2-oxoglutarate dehydrogenase complex dihydrolipoamide acyltransferase (E2) component
LGGLPVIEWTVICPEPRFSLESCVGIIAPLCEAPSGWLLGSYNTIAGWIKAMAVAILVEAVRGANLARIVAAPLASGTRVVVGQTLFEVENHKVVQEIECPVSGIFLHDLMQGDFIHLNVAIAFIAEDNENFDDLLAEAVLGKAGDEADWEFVVGVCPIGSPTEGMPVSIAKATEIAILGNGAGNSLQATLGAAIGPIWRSEATANFFQDKITDLLIYESSRLLATKKFRNLNAQFKNGRIVQHDHVSPGISFDEGGRLTLYTVADAEKLTLPETQDRLVEGLMRYVGRKLSMEEVATSTYTISDVTTTDLNLSVPLLPYGQCIILVVIRDPAQGYMLSISYDHRITEGLKVAGFAQELIKRLRSYSTPPATDDEQWISQAAVCAYCESGVETEVADFKRRGLLKIIDETHSEVYCCVTCWENW